MSPQGAGSYGIASNGTLVYVPGNFSTAFARNSLVWVDRKGLEQAIKAPPRAYIYPRLSPDGTRVALDIADYGYVMENGRIVLEGAAEELRNNEDVREFYLGLDLKGERKSYRDIKHYRRRKRWLG